MEKKTITYSALGGIGIILLTLFGANLFDGTHYYCVEKNISSQCDRFSSTGVRCYPQPVISTGYKDCSQGWALVIADTITIPNNAIKSTALKYSCDQKKCTPIN